MTANRRAEAGTEHKLADGKIGQTFTPCKEAPFIQERLKVFDALFQEQTAAYLTKERKPIRITLPDGSVKEGTSYETTPLSVAEDISKGLANNVIVAKIQYTSKVENDVVSADRVEGADGAEVDEDQSSQLWDLTRPLEGDCKLELLKFDSPEGQHVFWHSSAHILGEAIEVEFGAQLTVGPALAKGFYYDAYMGSTVIHQDMYPALEARTAKITSENQPFQRLVVTKEQCLDLFKDNPFKVQLVTNKVPDGAKTTAYRCGTLVDLCRGPHVPFTSKVKAMSIEKNSAAYWLGKATNDSLQRIYGISFPDKNQLKEHIKFMEEAKKRDHRAVGQQLSLMFFEPSVSAGSCFWLPEGAKIYNRLVDFMRSEYRVRGFEEVISPNMYSADFWKVSGHYQNYKDDMYMFEIEGKEWGLKPMNCPGHCVMFKHMNPSYRQLPLRLADFGVLHRNELSGSLTGLTRVRRFQQDDAHIFCRMDQVKAEVKDCLDFLFFIYGVFGFEFELRLATKPEKAMGEASEWEAAEDALRSALEGCGHPWSVNPGDGAFYGPKIDIRLKDAISRWHQCGTIQLDFQLPRRFNLQYRTDEVAQAKTHNAAEDSGAKAPVLEGSVNILGVTPQANGSIEEEVKSGFQRPVMIHRAILGSLERMIAVLIEHGAGRFPFWLSPRQVVVCPVSEKSNEYARRVKDALHAEGYHVSLDDSNHTISKKVRNAEIERWNMVLVVGEAETESKSVTVRHTGSDSKNEMIPFTSFLEMLSKEKMPKSRDFFSEV